MYLGNDIVDYKDENLKVHPRFINRVLSGSEKTAYHSSLDKDIFLWKSWAAKEAAYKYLKQKNPKIIFSHSKFVFNEDKNLIKHQTHSVPVKFHITDNYIYCYTVLNMKDAINIIKDINSLPLHNKRIISSFFTSRELKDISSTQSLAVRYLAKKTLAKQLNYKPLEVEIAKDKNGVPQLYHKNKKLNLPLSFSHDERYAAIAIEIT